MKTFIFKSFSEWRKFLWKAVKNLLIGVINTLISLVMGIVSVLVYLWQVACRFIGRNPGISLGAFFFLMFVVWTLTFVSMRTRAIGAESQRDSICWKYQQFKETHGYE